MASNPPLRPSNGARCTINAGLWTSSTGRTNIVTVDFDARLLIDFVQVAARSTNNAATFGLGVPPATVTLT